MLIYPQSKTAQIHFSSKDSRRVHHRRGTGGNFKVLVRNSANKSDKPIDVNVDYTDWVTTTSDVWPDFPFKLTRFIQIS